MLVSELGNLTAGILLSPCRMSTVKIRARSLFRTPMSRIGAKGAGFGQWGRWKTGIPVELASLRRKPERFSSVLHKVDRTFTGCTQAAGVSHLRKPAYECRVREYNFSKVES
jgi:hypothetical protein